MKHATHPLILALFFVVLGVPTGAAQEPGNEEHGEHESKHQGLKNEISLFLGVTDEEGHDIEFTWGLEYVYQIAHRWGIGGLFDYAGGELRNAVFGIPVYYYPGGRWKLLAAPGIEFHNGRGPQVEPHKSEGGETVDNDEKYFLFRVGVGYDIILGQRYSIIPTLNLDFVNGHKVWIAGFNFAHKF